MALSAIPTAVAGLRTLTLAMLISNGGATGLLITMGLLLAKIALVAAAFTAAYKVGSLVYDKFIAGTGFGDAIGGGIANTMAFLGNDEAKQSVASNERASLITQQAKNRLDGQLNININGLPQGSRVEQDTKGNMPLNLDVGMRGFAYGAP